MKKIINTSENVIPEMLGGLVLERPDIELIEKYKIVKKKNLNSQKVSLISGGGSGHEPAHAGYVGEGMLDAAVCGDVFASPSQIQVYQAIKAAASEKGVLLIIKNYSGDVMNFKNAAALAEEDGIHVDYVKVDDDVAVKDSLYTVGHRGVAGTVFVHKIAGAAAQKGYDLLSVKAVAEKAIANVRSIGFAFSSCTVPAKGTPTFQLVENEMEYGVGIHGEPGVRRERVISADELAERMTKTLSEELHLEKEQSPEVAVLINGFGATPLMELYILHNAVQKALHQRGVGVYRAFVGNFMTSIDMAGASVTFLKMDASLKELLSEKSEAPAFRVSGEIPVVPYMETEEGAQKKRAVQACHFPSPVIKNEQLTLENILFMVEKLRDDIMKNEQAFWELDSHAGDGDFGTTTGYRYISQ